MAASIMVIIKNGLESSAEKAAFPSWQTLSHQQSWPFPLECWSKVAPERPFITASMWGQQQTEEYMVTRSSLQMDRVVERTEQRQPDLAMQSKGTWGTEFTGCPCKTPTASTLLTALMLPMHMYQSLQGWTSCLLQKGSCLAAGKSTVGGSPKKHFTWEWEDKARRKLASVYLDTRMPSTWRLGRSAQGCLWRSFSYSHSNPVGQHLPMVSW